MPETWRDVAGYEGAYEVSDLGRVRSLGRRTRCNTSGYRTWAPQDIKLVVRNATKRYLFFNARCTIRGNRSLSVHRVVAEAFLGPCPDGLQVDHIDGDKANNAVTNLRYVTGSANIRAAHAAGRNKSGITDADVRKIRAAHGITQRELAEHYGVDPSFISKLRTGHYRPHA